MISSRSTATHSSNISIFAGFNVQDFDEGGGITIHDDQSVITVLVGDRTQLFLAKFGLLGRFGSFGGPFSQFLNCFSN
jgi:hypothetical protein